MCFEWVLRVFAFHFQKKKILFVRAALFVCQTKNSFSLSFLIHGGI